MPDVSMDRDERLGCSAGQVDLGSWLTGCVSQQCAVAAEMANQLLWCINHRVHSQLEEVIVVLCLVLAHPHLEYCVQSGL